MKTFSLTFADNLLAALAQRCGWVYESDFRKADILLFPGGPDVDPVLYGEKKHRASCHDPEKNKIESEYFKALEGTDTTKIGICGGGQILNVLNGGRMFQHSNHPGLHALSVKLPVEEERIVQVNSTHHQLMRLGENARLWGWTRLADFRETVNGPPERINEKDNEIIWYPSTNSLCFQPHPEYGHRPTEELFKDCIQVLGLLG